MQLLFFTAHYPAAQSGLTDIGFPLEEACDSLLEIFVFFLSTHDVLSFLCAPSFITSSHFTEGPSVPWPAVQLTQESGVCMSHTASHSTDFSPTFIAKADVCNAVLQ